jgi:hypothetical protein
MTQRDGAVANCQLRSPVSDLINGKTIAGRSFSIISK